MEEHPHSLKGYLRRQSTDVLEVLLMKHNVGTEKLDEDIAQFIFDILQQRWKEQATEL